MPEVVKLQRRAAASKQPQKKSWLSRLGYVRSTMRRRTRRQIEDAQSRKLFAVPEHPPGVVPRGVDFNEPPSIAQDDNIGEAWTWAAQGQYSSAFAEGTTFLGYAYLAALAQRAEYQIMTGVLSQEMTREWIEIKSRSGKDKAQKIKELMAALNRYRLKDHFKTIAQSEALFGRAHLYIELRVNPESEEEQDGELKPGGTATGGGLEASDDREELMTSIGDGNDKRTRRKVKKGSLIAFRPVEAVWCYPTRYGSNDPLKADWYQPTTWYVMGKEVHVTRLILFVSRPVPDLLKPAYSFGGLALTQMAKPYVDNWLKTRQSVSDITQNFSIPVLSTVLSTTLQEGGEELFERTAFFNETRDNQGLMLLDKETEDFSIASASLAGLDGLQSQSQEHMFSVSQIPSVKFAGLTPTGLNASSEGEFRAFYDTIHARQEEFFRTPLTKCINIIQLSEFGEIDDDLEFTFKSLWQMDEAGKSAIEKEKADIDDAYLAAGVLKPEEVRRRVAEDPESIYANLELDPDDVPEQEQALGGGQEPPGIEALGGGGSTGAPGGGLSPPKDKHDALQGVTTRAAEHGAGFGFDKAVWEEQDHPRDDDGKFSTGSSTGSVGNTTHRDTKFVSFVSGAYLPDHIAKLRVPPAWRDVHYSPDPNADLLVVGRDVKGRRQAIYSPRFAATQAAAKFARISDLEEKFKRITDQNKVAQNSNDPRIRDSADVLALIMNMGLRPGSAEDTGADKKAFGATTLEARHVVETPDGVRLKFIGKKGVSIDLLVKDPHMSSMLKARARQAGSDGLLFPHTSSAALLKYVSSLDGGGFKTKDFRTYLASRTAQDEVNAGRSPQNEKEYKKAVLEVAKKVAARLGNTPVVALQSYINPVVFAPWRAAAGV